MSDSRLVTIAGMMNFNGAAISNPNDRWYGVEFEITDVTGMGDPAAVFTSEQNVAADGVWATTGYRGPRAIGLQGVIRGSDEVRTENAFDDLRNLIKLSEFPVSFAYMAGTRTVWCRRDGELVQETRELPTEIRWSCVLKCIDPAIYAGDAFGSGTVTLTTGLPLSSGGLTFPVTFPVTFGGSSSAGDVSITLPSGGGAVTFRINGPVTDPQIVVQDAVSLSPRRLAWLGTIPAGMWLDVDPRKRQALLQGQSSRPPYVRQWPTLSGSYNIIRFRAAAYDTGTLTATVRPIL